MATDDTKLINLTDLKRFKTKLYTDLNTINIAYKNVENTFTSLQIFSGGIVSSSVYVRNYADTDYVQIAGFYEEADIGLGPEVASMGHFRAHGYSDPTTIYKPFNRTGFEGNVVEALYFNTGITTFDSNDGAFHNYSFPGKTGTIALTNDLDNVAYKNVENTFTSLQIFSGGIDVTGGTLKINVINAKTSSSSTTYGPGTSGQVLKSNGTNVYWASDSNSNYYPIRSYTSGLKISTYSGSQNCELYVPNATDTQAGVVSTGDQTFSGKKTFNRSDNITPIDVNTTQSNAARVLIGYKINGSTYGYIGCQNDSTPIYQEPTGDVVHPIALKDINNFFSVNQSIRKTDPYFWLENSDSKWSLGFHVYGATVGSFITDDNTSTSYINKFEYNLSTKVFSMKYDTGFAFKGTSTDGSRTLNAPISVLGNSSEAGIQCWNNDGTTCYGAMFLNKDHTPFIWDTSTIYEIITSKTILDKVYPVGSIYFSTNSSASPASLFGGTWEKLNGGNVYLWKTNVAYVVTNNSRHSGNPNPLMFDYIHDGTTSACAEMSKNLALASNGVGLTISQLDGSSWGSNWGGWGTAIPNNLVTNAAASTFLVYAWRRIS